MRNIFIITILLSLFSSPSWSETLTLEDLVLRNNLYYKKFTDVPFTGEIFGLENGRFKNGELEGFWKYHYKNGQLRNKGNYNKTRNKKVFTDRTIRTTGPTLWNSLAEEMKHSKSIEHFRKKIKLSLL